MLQEGEELPRLVIVDQKSEDDDGEYAYVLNTKNKEPPAGIVDPELRKMWHDFRAINKARPDRDLELPRNLSDDDVAIMLNAIARGEDAAGAQLALVMSKFFPLKDDTDQADSSNQQQDAKPAEAVVKGKVEERSRSRSKEPKILVHSSQVTKVKEPKKMGRPSKSVLVPHQASRCEILGEIASKKRQKEVAVAPREIPKGRHKRSKSEVLPLMNNKRLSTPRENTTSYKMKLSPIWKPLNISLLDSPSSETDEVIQMSQPLGPDQDMAEEQAIPTNGRQMDSSLAIQPNSQNFGMMPRLVCYHGGVPHPFCGPLPNFMVQSSMQLHAYHNQATQWSNYAYNFPGPQASDSMVNGWFENGWNTQFMPSMTVPTPFYQPMQMMQPHPSVHQEPLRDDNGGKENPY